MANFDEQEALIFIPDISGFSQFVSDRELKHSHHIIAELLEILIESNNLKLEVNEIEGDAILFYRLAECPPINEIVNQAKIMYLAFHEHLKKYGISRICNCPACKSVGRLTLKIIMHFGSVSFHRIKGREKLFGADIIKAHRLLKNNIGRDEYILISEPILDKALSNIETENWVKWTEGSDSYDIGMIRYFYTSLEPVYSQVPEPVFPNVNLYRSKSPMVYEIDINAPIDIVYEALIDLNQRVKWMSGIKSIRILDESLNQMNKICTSFECTLEHEKCTFQTSQVKFAEHMLKFSETFLEQPMTFDYSVEDGDNHVKLTLECHAAFKQPMKWIFEFFMKKKFGRQTLESLKQLKDYCEKISTNLKVAVSPQ